MLTDLYFYLAAVPAVLIVGISKGGFGGSLGFLGVPLMALIVAPPQAAAILLPILCVMDLFTVWAWRRQWDKRNVMILIPASLVGIAFGAALYRYLNVDALRVFLGTLALIFGVFHVWRAHLAAAVEKNGPSWWRGGFWGALAGLTSFTAHAGGPPTVMYLLPQRLHPSVYQGTIAIVFIVINYMKLLPYWWLGQLSVPNLSTSLVLLPLAPLGIWLGVWLHNRVSEKAFYGLVLVALLGMGSKLIYDGAVGLLA